MLSGVIHDNLTAAVLTMVEDDTAGATVSAASPLALDEGGTATCTVAECRPHWCATPWAR